MDTERLSEMLRRTDRPVTPTPSWSAATDHPPSAPVTVAVVDDLLYVGPFALPRNG